jgi:hypothetical protein
MAMTLERYSEWKHHPGTQELMMSLRETLEMYIAKMVNRSRPDNDEDQFIRAYAKLTDEVLSWRPEIVESIQEVDDVEN